MDIWTLNRYLYLLPDNFTYQWASLSGLLQTEVSTHAPTAPSGLHVSPAWRSLSVPHRSPPHSGTRLPIHWHLSSWHCEPGAPHTPPSPAVEQCSPTRFTETYIAGIRDANFIYLSFDNKVPCGVKVSMSTHTCPRKSLRNIKWPYAITRLTTQFTRGPIFDCDFQA